MKNHKGLAWLIAVLAVLSFVASACGSDSDGGSEGSSGSKDDSTTTAADALLLGGSYRNLSVIRPSQAGSPYTFIPVMQGDLYGQLRLGIFRMGGSVGIGRSRPGSTNGRLAQVTTNQDGYNLVSRSHYIGVDLGKNKSE